MEAVTDTSNDFDGEAVNVVQAGATGDVHSVHQHVENGLAIQGDVNGGITLTFGGTPTTDGQEPQ